MNKDSDNEYVYDDEESRLLEEKKEALKNEAKKMKEQETDTFWKLYDIKVEQEIEKELSDTEKMELELGKRFC